LAIRTRCRLKAELQTLKASALISFVGLAEFGEDAEIFERGSIAFDFAAGGDLFEEAAHDFAGAGFGQGFGEADVVGFGDGTDFLRDLLAKFVAQ
jgi:hypothetical protein